MEDRKERVKQTLTNERLESLPVSKKTKKTAGDYAAGDIADNEAAQQALARCGVEDCRFCQMMLGEGVFRLENELAVAFMDGSPVNKGHLLVIPKRRVKDWWGATQEERLAIFELIDEAKKMIDGEYHPDGYNYRNEFGRKGGAERDAFACAFDTKIRR